MDSHFEVILERVKNLTSKSQKTVWFERHTNEDGTAMLVLINEDNRIGIINVTYENETPELFATRVDKITYEKLLQNSVTLDSIKHTTKKKYQPKDIVKWVSGD